MSQRHVEVIIGRLVTDERLRQQFMSAGSRVLDELAGLGLELTASERAALVATPVETWATLAATIDPRLQKASLRTDDPDAECVDPHPVASRVACRRCLPRSDRGARRRTAGPHARRCDCRGAGSQSRARRRTRERHAGRRGRHACRGRLRSGVPRRRPLPRPDAPVDVGALGSSPGRARAHHARLPRQRRLVAAVRLGGDDDPGHLGRARHEQLVPDAGVAGVADRGLRRAAPAAAPEPAHRPGTPRHPRLTRDTRPLRGVPAAHDRRDDSGGGARLLDAGRCGPRRRDPARERGSRGDNNATRSGRGSRRR